MKSQLVSILAAATIIAGLLSPQASANEEASSDLLTGVEASERAAGPVAAKVRASAKKLTTLTRNKRYREARKYAWRSVVAMLKEWEGERPGRCGRTDFSQQDYFDYDGPQKWSCDFDVKFDDGGHGEAIGVGYKKIDGRWVAVDWMHLLT